MKIKSMLSEKFLILLIVINLTSFTNISLFNIYDSLFFYVNLASIISIILLQNRFIKKDIELIMFLLLFLSYGLLTLFITDGGIGSVLTPFYSILVYFVIKRTAIREKSVKVIMWLMIALNIFLFINSQGYYTNWYFNRDRYINPNTIGMVMMYTCIYSSIFLRKLNVKNQKKYTLLVYIISVIGILNVQSRGSLLALISFIILDTIFSKKIWKNKKFTVIFYLILVFIGVLIPYAYTQLYNSGFQFIIPFTDKPIYTGREVIWNNFYYELSNNNISLFFGLGSNANLWGGQSLNLHNNYLGVLANFGVLGFILYYSFWFFQIKSFFRQRIIENFQISLLLGFFTVLINGFFEISTLWHVMFFFNFMFLGLAFNEK